MATSKQDIPQRDRYQGEQQPITRIRHGKGKYIYENSYFTYQGDWVNGLKHGYGILSMKDGSKYEGNFQNNEIIGEGTMHYSNGSKYTGHFLLGEKNGQGIYQSSGSEYYEGNWEMNLKSGQGKYINNFGDTYIGMFKDNKPNGKCQIIYQNGNNYMGEMLLGLKNGFGIYQDKIYDIKYEGNWENDLKSGLGILSQIKNQYKYEGMFDQDQAKIKANKLIYHLINQNDNVVDNSSKNQKELNLIDPFINYEINGHPISFQLNVVYQGVDIEDPNQLTKEEIDDQIQKWQKEMKKQKNPPPMPDFHAKKMIPSQPINISMESGRKIKIQLIQKNEQDHIIGTFRVDYRRQISDRKIEIEKIKNQIEQDALLIQQQQQQQEQQIPKNKKDSKNKIKQQQVNQVTEVDFSLKLYKDDELEENKPLYVQNECGTVLLQNLEYPEDFPIGKYYYMIEDKGFNAAGTFDPIYIEINIQPIGGTVEVQSKKQIKKK